MPINPSPKWRASISASQKRLWQNPEHRAKMVEARRRLIPLWQAHPERFSRRGVPNGMRKPEAMKLWSEANRLSDLAMRGFEKQGVVPKVPMRSEAALLPIGIPETDEEIAKLCLREACVLALGPVGDKRTKLQALGTVLKYTKPRPRQRLAVASTSTEDWLREAIMAGQRSSRYRNPQKTRMSLRPVLEEELTPILGTQSIFAKIKTRSPEP